MGFPEVTLWPQGMAEPYDGLTAKRKPSNQGHLWMTAVAWAVNDWTARNVCYCTCLTNAD